MAIWQYDAYAILRAALLTALGRVPLTLADDDEERLDLWRDVDQNALTAKLDDLLPRVAGWDSFVLVWGADSGDRADLCLAENGSIAFLRFRINLRRRSRGFLNRVISLAAAEDWLLLARDSRCLLPPEPAAVLADMERSDAARCVSDPEKFIREVRGDEPDWPRDRRVYCPAECREHELRVTWVPAGSCATALFRTHNPKDEHERLQPA